MSVSVYPLPHRRVLKVDGADRFDFLQGLITHDIFLLKSMPALYTALLNQQGRYLFDFFIIAQEDHFLIETDDRMDELLALLKMYKLRRQVHFETLEASVFITHACTHSDKHTVIFEDPRLPNLWQRGVSFSPESFIYKENIESSLHGYHYQRILKCLPDSKTDLIVGRTFPLEAGLDQLNAMSFKKGCYIGQEPVARAYYQGVVRKKLMPIRIDGPPPPYGGNITQEDNTVGDLRSTVVFEGEAVGIAMIRLEALDQKAPLMCEGQAITVISPQR